MPPNNLPEHGGVHIYPRDRVPVIFSAVAALLVAFAAGLVASSPLVGVLVALVGWFLLYSSLQRHDLGPNDYVFVLSGRSLENFLHHRGGIVYYLYRWHKTSRSGVGFQAVAYPSSDPLEVMSSDGVPLKVELAFAYRLSPNVTPTPAEAEAAAADAAAVAAVAAAAAAATGTAEAAAAADEAAAVAADTEAVAAAKAAEFAHKLWRLGLPDGVRDGSVKPQLAQAARQVIPSFTAIAAATWAREDIRTDIAALLFASLPPQNIQPLGLTLGNLTPADLVLEAWIEQVRISIDPALSRHKLEEQRISSVSGANAIFIPADTALHVSLPGATPPGDQSV